MMTHMRQSPVRCLTLKSILSISRKKEILWNFEAKAVICQCWCYIGLRCVTHSTVGIVRGPVATLVNFNCTKANPRSINYIKAIRATIIIIICAVDFVILDLMPWRVKELLRRGKCTRQTLRKWELLSRSKNGIGSRGSVANNAHSAGQSLFGIILSTSKMEKSVSVFKRN